MERSWTLLRKLLCSKSIAEVFVSFLRSSMSRFNFARLFWNHVITWALVRRSVDAISSLSAGVRYFWNKKRFSSSKIWWFVKAVRDFLFFLGCRSSKAAKEEPPSGTNEKRFSCLFGRYVKLVHRIAFVVRNLRRHSRMIYKEFDAVNDTYHFTRKSLKQVIIIYSKTSNILTAFSNILS